MKMPRPPLIALYSPPKRVEAMEFLFNEMPDGMMAAIALWAFARLR